MEKIYNVRNLSGLLFTLFAFGGLFGVNEKAWGAWNGSGQGTKQDGVWYVLYGESGEIYTIGKKEFSLSGPGAQLTFDGTRTYLGAGNLKVTDGKTIIFNDIPGQQGWTSVSTIPYGPYDVDVDATTIKFYTEAGATLTKYFSNVNVTMAQYLENPSETAFDFGSADVDTEDATGTFTIAWCNVPEMTYEITGEGAAAYSVAVENNSQEGAWSTATFTVTYSHAAGGVHDATLVISDTYKNYSKSISLHGESVKFDQSIIWEQAETVNYGATLATATATSGLDVTYEISNPNVVKYEKGSLTATYAGTTTVTAKQVGNHKYNAAVEVVKTITVVAPTTYGDFEDVACDQAIEFFGQSYSESFTGDVKVGKNYMGGDSIVHVAITINHASTGSDSKTITFGDDASWNGIALGDSTVGEHRVVFTTTNTVGCDSVVTLALTVEKMQVLEVAQTLEFCAGDSAEYLGKWYYKAEDSEVKQAIGAVRDTVYQVTVIVHETSAIGEELTITEGDDAEWNGFALKDSVAGSYTLVYETTNVAGCDSIVTLTLTVKEKEDQGGTTGFENIRHSEADVQKFFRNGVMYIRRGERIYGLDGKKVE